MNGGDIVSAAAAALKGRFPGLTLYAERMGRAFVRPSIFLQASWSDRPLLGRRLERTFILKALYFPPQGGEALRRGEEAGRKLAAALSELPCGTSVLHALECAAGPRERDDALEFTCRYRVHCLRESEEDGILMGRKEGGITLSRE